MGSKTKLEDVDLSKGKNKKEKPKKGQPQKTNAVKGSEEDYDNALNNFVKRFTNTKFVSMTDVKENIIKEFKEVAK